MAQDYESYLHRLHSAFSADEDVIREVVAEVSKAAITAKRRVVAGEANEVYDVALADGLKVIVRVSRTNYDRELWAIARCREAGVKVPDVLLTKTKTMSGQALTFCVQRKIEGMVLTPPTIAELTETERRKIVHELGAMLAKVHSIPTAGRGYIDGNGQGEPAPTLQAVEAMEAEYMELAVRTGVEARNMQAILADLLPAWSALRDSGCLVHNDFRAAHVIVASGAVSGIIDWGEAASGDPVDDFAEWDYWDGKALPVAWLRNAYENEASLDISFDDKIRVKKLEYGLCLLSWYASQNYEEGIRQAISKLLARPKAMHP